MFCKFCGTACEAEVCPNCAAQRAQQSQRPVQQARPQQAVGNVDLFQTLKAYWHYILVGIAFLAFVWGILNLCSVFHVRGAVKVGSKREAEYGSVSDVADTMDAVDSSAATVYIGNILFGLSNLGVAAIGALYFLKMFKNMPYYDQILGKLKFRPAFMMGALAAAGSLLQVIMYMFCRYSDTIKTYGLTGKAKKVKMVMSFGVNWTTWVILAFSVGLLLLDKLVLEKKEQ